MITQVLLNFFRDVFVAFLSALPPLPGEWLQMLQMMKDGGAWLSGTLSQLGVLIPWNGFTTILIVWLGLLGFWVTVQGIRIIAWAVGR